MMPRADRSILPAIVAAAVLGACGGDDEGAGGDAGEGGADTAHGASSSSGAGPDCADQCAEIGFGGGTLDEGECVCGAPLDEACFSATSAVCACDASIDQPCSDLDTFNYYTRCFQDLANTRDLLLCVIEYVDEETVDCEAAKEACVP